jgi:hypothetical protein
LLANCVTFSVSKQKYERYGVGKLIADCEGNKCLDAYDNVIVVECSKNDLVDATFAGFQLQVCRATAPFLATVDPGPNSGLRLVHVKGERSGRASDIRM